MEWIMKQATFTYNGKEVTRQTYTYEHLFGTFKVYESVGGKIFYSYPSIKLSDRGKFISPGCKFPINSILDGLSICNKIMNKYKEEVYDASST